MTGIAMLAWVASVQAAAVFYSFQTTEAGGTFTLEPTAVSGFADASTVTRTGGGLANAGGESSFTDFNGTTWTGSGSNATGGFSLAWNPGSTNNSFSLTLDTTGLQDLNIRFAVRSATSTSTPAVANFASFSYDLGDGAGPQAITTGINSFTTGNNTFSPWTADLSSITALNDQPAVTFTWIIPSIPNNMSFRVDNIQITAAAIPEPSTAAVIFGVAAIGAVCARRRRVHGSG